MLVSGKNPDHDVYELLIEHDGSPIAAIALEVLNDPSLPKSGPGRYDNGNFALGRFEVEVVPTDQPEQIQPIRFARALATHEEGSDKITGAIDDDRATSWCTNTRGGHAVFVLTEPLVASPSVRLRIRMHHDSKWRRHGIGRFRLWTTSQTPPDAWQADGVPPLRALAVASIPQAERTAGQQEHLTTYYRSVAPELAPLRDRLAELESEIADLQSSRTLVLVETDEPRETRLLIRGSFLDPGELVDAGVPEAWHPWPHGARRDRLGLARWLMDRDNPLVGRVTMNRIWAMYFGHGIVKTSEDFGSQGSPPTHPKLLDYLATKFADSGWNVQAMQKQIVMSATYRQSSRLTPALRERDPYNTRYARGGAFRLDAETIRDNALAVSGLLNRRLGGPGVYPYQPPGVFEQIHGYTTKWDTSSDGDQFRRGLYTYWKRTAPYPSFIAFDASRRNVCVERRPRTNLSKHSLRSTTPSMSNARPRSEDESPLKEATPSARATHGFRLCVARQPSPREVRHLVELYQQNLKIYQSEFPKGQHRWRTHQRE